jgi:hypothetical protein
VGLKHASDINSFCIYKSHSQEKRRNSSEPSLDRFWCKYEREAKQGTRRSKAYAGRTAFQIEGTVWFLRRRLTTDESLTVLGSTKPIQMIHSR